MKVANGMNMKQSKTERAMRPIWSALLVLSLFGFISCKNTPQGRPVNPMVSNFHQPAANVIFQSTPKNCGAAALATLDSFYSIQNRGKITERQVQRFLGRAPKDGFSMYELKYAAEQLGYPTKVLKIEGRNKAVEFIHKAHRATIIRLKDEAVTHFVVYLGYKNGFVFFADPTLGEIKVPLEDFQQSFTGYFLWFLNDRTSSLRTPKHLTKVQNFPTAGIHLLPPWSLQLRSTLRFGKSGKTKTTNSESTISLGLPEDFELSLSIPSLFVDDKDIGNNFRTHLKLSLRHQLLRQKDYIPAAIVDLSIGAPGITRKASSGDSNDLLEIEELSFLTLGGNSLDNGAGLTLLYDIGILSVFARQTSTVRYTPNTENNVSPENTDPRSFDIKLTTSSHYQLVWSIGLAVPFRSISFFASFQTAYVSKRKFRFKTNNARGVLRLKASQDNSGTLGIFMQISPGMNLTFSLERSLKGEGRAFLIGSSLNF